MTIKKTASEIASDFGNPDGLELEILRHMEYHIAITNEGQNYMSDADVLEKLIEVADAGFGGHLTIMKFTTNWRVAFGTPHDWDDVQKMSEGEYFEDAAKKAIKQMDAPVVPEKRP